MRYQNVFFSAVYTAALLGGAHAEDESSSTESTSTTTSIIEKPTFTPLAIKGAPFFEQFTDDWETRWTPSKAKKDDPKTDEDWAYIGEWAVEEPSVFKGIEGDKGLLVKNKAAHHAISAKFPKKIDNKSKTLVAQYEVKLNDGLECGGAYMKLLQDNKKLHAEEFSNSSPYIVMFGPDKCGMTNKVHFIFRHKNPKTGEYEEKHLKSPPPARTDKLTHLYTLIVKPDQTFEIRIDGKSVKSGSLLEDFDPAVNPPKEIEDAKDEKPADWVDDAQVADPEATKPEDWDEDAPFEIPDAEAVKPEGWLDNEPALVPDPEAEKPEDWDDEEDGDWLPPTIGNPKCEEVGCGPWERPTIRNPDYKGKWSAPLIDNPLYKGVWTPRLIKNPAYFEDKTPSNLEPMGAIGFEIWTMQNDILFDNIYIGHSIEEAEKIQADTFDIKSPIEKAEEEASKPTPEDTPKSPSEVDFKSDPVEYAKVKFNLFFTILKLNPMEAVKAVPEVAGVLGVGLLTLLVVLVGAIGGSSAPQKAKEAGAKAADKAKEAKDKAADAASSGAEKVQSEINKRTTRSSAGSSE